MKLFVTGATGYIGRFLLPLLAQSPFEVVCLVRPGSDDGRIRAAGAAPVEGDVTDRDSVAAGMAGCEAVVHLAGVVSYWERDPLIYQQTNVEGTFNVLTAALAQGVKKIVHVSSSAVYCKDSSDGRPLREESPHSSAHRAEYARSKRAAELLARQLQREKSLPLVTLYPGLVAGPGRAVPSNEYLRQLLKGRLPARFFEDAQLPVVDVRDAAEAVVRALLKKNNLGQEYIIGRHAITLAEFNEMACRIAGVPLPTRRLPDKLALAASAVNTWLAESIQQEPRWGFSLDLARTLAGGCRLDGSKAERELKLKYRPLQPTLEAAIHSTLETIK